MSDADVFHAGEIAVQVRTGERAVAQRRGGMIQPDLVEGARFFLARQGVAAVVAAEPDGALWASLWCGAPGFLRADAGGGQVEVVAALDYTVAADPVRPLIRDGVALGMLVIDFATRRRLRINGVVSHAGPGGLKLEVREAFGNCPKYIQRRERSDAAADGEIAAVEQGQVLDEPRLELISRTDTGFVASIHPERGLDVSHRGGEPGFVQVASDGTLRIPDYPGNSMFQTLGNFAVDPRAGLALIDFERRLGLSLTGKAVTVFDAEDSADSTGGTGRYWSFTVERWVQWPLPSRLTWTLLDRSPFNPSASRPAPAPAEATD